MPENKDIDIDLDSDILLTDEEGLEGQDEFLDNDLDLQLDGDIDEIDGIYENLDDDGADDSNYDINSDFDTESNFDLNTDFDNDISLDGDNTSEDEPITAINEDDSYNKDHDIDISLEEKFDIKNDLGLKDELKLSEDEESLDLDDGDFDFDFNEEAKDFLTDFEEEFGVDLKSGPETILKDDELSSEIDTIINDDDFDKKLEEDTEVVKVKIPEKRDLTVSEDQIDFLNSKIEDDSEESFLDTNHDFEIGGEKLEISVEDKDFSSEVTSSSEKTSKNIEDMSIDIMEENALEKSFNDDSLISEDDLLNLEEDESTQIDLSEDIINNEDYTYAKLADNEITLDETVVDEDITLIDEETNAELETKDQEMIETVGDLPMDDILSEEPVNDEQRERDDIIDIDSDFDIDMEIEEINTDTPYTSNDLVEFDDDMELSKDIDSNIELDDKDIELNIEDDLTDGESDLDLDIETSGMIEDDEYAKNMEEGDLGEDDMLNNQTTLDDEKIILDTSELSELEGTMLPDDDDMPELDLDILDNDLSLDSDEGIDISPLGDSDSVFSDDITDEDSSLTKDGDVTDIDLESIPEPSVKSVDDYEDETIGLSGNELDAILNTTEILETDADIDNMRMDSELANEDITDSFDTDIEDTESIEDSVDIDDVDLDIELSDALEDEETLSLSLDESQETETKEDETETIDLSSFDADFNEVETKTLTEKDTMDIETTVDLGVSPEEEEDIYAGLKEICKKKTEEHKEGGFELKKR